MLIHKITTGLLEENCWILRDHDAAVVIDPGGRPAEILAKIGNANVTWILLTHSHYDHLETLAEIWEKTKAPVAIHAAEADFVEQGHANPPGARVQLSPVPVEKKLADGDVLKFGNSQIEVIHTPGHTPGSCCFLVKSELFSGDTLFHENIGRFDLPGGDLEDLKKSLARLLKLPPETIVHPGHGTDWTIREAKKFNFPI